MQIGFKQTELTIMMSKQMITLLGLFILTFTSSTAQQKERAVDKFAQLYEELPTPGVYRNAAGAPGHQYWQQRADYKMRIELDDNEQKIYGAETISYTNNSPDALAYLWVQLDQNVRTKNSDSYAIEPSSIREEMNPYELYRLMNRFDGGFHIEWVKDKRDKDLPYTINKTMMRVDLAEPLKPGATYIFKIKWWYPINDGMQTFARSGYEYFPNEDNYMYNIAQFYPRMCSYNETEGWQNKQFLGRGEFALSFGDYEVDLVVPADHIVASTGVLQNPKDVLSEAQQSRLEKAKTAEKPIMIVTQAEATENEKTKAEETKTWTFKAKNVRDFAFATSRKLIWDAQGVPFGDRTVMAMSFYPKEANPLWEKYSTQAVVHTLKVYSKYTFDYPYPVAISTHAAFTGMEYPMICFNFGRPRPDGSYPARTKYRMISVIIHEVGHNYFPMIVNSDERQWTWMDEGLNSFLQYLAQCEWQRDYPSRRGPAHKIVPYMKGDKDNMVPIMSNSESILQFGNNAYGKPATALNILRETIMGRELFDHAFKIYSNRWKFKHPTPADFFRTMEDASGVDLDWFWRGWFYSTDHVDIALADVKWFRINSHDTEAELLQQQKWDQKQPRYIADLRNEKGIKKTLMEENPELEDLYNKMDKYEPTELDKAYDKRYLGRLSKEERDLLEVAHGYNYYELQFENKGGLVMPIIIELTYADGSTERKVYPAEVWKSNSEKVSKVILSTKKLVGVNLDPNLETADVDRSNNYFPAKVEPTRFEMFLRN